MYYNFSYYCKNSEDDELFKCLYTVQWFVFCQLANVERSNLYLKLFKLVFGSVSLLANENEQMLKVTLSMHSCTKATMAQYIGLTSSWPHQNSDVGLEEELSLCYSLVLCSISAMHIAQS